MQKDTYVYIHVRMYVCMSAGDGRLAMAPTPGPTNMESPQEKQGFLGSRSPQYVNPKESGSSFLFYYICFNCIICVIVFVIGLRVNLL